MRAGDFHTVAGAGARPALSMLRAPFGLAAPPVVVWLPALLIGLPMVVPLAYLVVRGAGASGEAWDLLLRLRTLQILWRSLLLVGSVTTLSLVLALPVAWLTVRTDLPYRNLWAVLTALPLVIPSYVGAFLVVSALGPKGLLQGLLSSLFGVDRLPDIHGLSGATVTLTLLSYPYVLLTLRGVLLNTDPSFEEAARILGDRPWRVLKRVTLPMLRPAIAAGSLLVALYTLSDFGAVSLLRYETFTWAIYQQYQTAFDRSVASVLSLLLVAFALVVLVTEAYTRGRMKYYQTGSGVPRSQIPVRLGGWKWAALGFCTTLVSAALVLPMGVLVYWLIRGVGSGEPLMLLWQATWNSVYVSVLAALVASICSIPVAVLVVRFPGLFSRVAERLSFTGYALPGIVVALSLVFFGANFARPVYQTLWILLLAYMVLFFPAALGSTRAVLLQISPRIEEAARGLGRSPIRTMATITAPLMRSGLLAGAALVFLLTMKELPATLILGPLGFRTLATAIWSASSEAFFARAAAPALTLILISSVPIAFLMLRERKVLR